MERGHAWQLLDEESYVINEDVRHSAWKHEETGAIIYAEEAVHPDNPDGTYHVAWLEPEGDHPIEQSFDSPEHAKDYALTTIQGHPEGIPPKNGG